MINDLRAADLRQKTQQNLPNSFCRCMYYTLETRTISVIISQKLRCNAQKTSPKH